MLEAVSTQLLTEEDTNFPWYNSELYHGKFVSWEAPPRPPEPAEGTDAVAVAATFEEYQNKFNDYVGDLLEYSKCARKFLEEAGKDIGGQMLWEDLCVTLRPSSLRVLHEMGETGRNEIKHWRLLCLNRGVLPLGTASRAAHVLRVMPESGTKVLPQHLATNILSSTIVKTTIAIVA